MFWETTDKYEVKRTYQKQEMEFYEIQKNLNKIYLGQDCMNSAEDETSQGHQK